MIKQHATTIIILAFLSQTLIWFLSAYQSRKFITKQFSKKKKSNYTDIQVYH